MELRTEKAGNAVIISPQGDVDLSNSRDLQTELRQVLSTKPARVVVNLADVPYMDSSGVATLVEAMQIARNGGSSLVLCAMRDKVRSIFEIARLDKVFRIVDSLEDAKAA